MKLGSSPRFLLAVKVVVALLLGCACAWFVHAVEDVQLSAPAEQVAQYPYRVIFWLTIPLRGGLATAWQFDTPARVQHFWGPWVALVLPLFVWGVYRYFRWRWFRLRRQWERKQEADPKFNPSRRAFMIQSSAAVAGVSAAGMGSYTSLLTPQQLVVTPYEFAVRDLPKSLEGLRIAHVSDTHYGPFITRDYLYHAIDTVNALEPDLILLTGDYVHRTPYAIPEGVGMLKELRARLGALAVLGNHDHWEGAEEVRRHFAARGIPLIDNDRRFVTGSAISSGGGAGSLCIGGVGDYWEDDVKPAKALADVPERMPRLLLSHNPDVAEINLPKHLRVDLMLSGHTHGGQVRFPSIGTPMVPSLYGDKYCGGLVQGPQCPVLVSTGVGLAVLPVRFRVPPEIVLLTLTA